MYDLYRTTREAELGAYELSPEYLEYSGEAETIGENLAETLMHESGLYETYPEAGSHECELPLSESDEMELAAELLEITNEAELDRFLGNLVRKVGGAAKRFIRSPLARGMIGALKPLAKVALPMLGKVAGSALGSAMLPGVGTAVGGMLGSQLASGVGSLFGLELEGLSVADREFEVARRFVRFAGAAVKNAAKKAPSADIRTAGRMSLVEAARTFAPGLIPKIAPAESVRCSCGNQIPLKQATNKNVPVETVPVDLRRRGTWIRRGQQIVVLGA